MMMLRVASLKNSGNPLTWNLPGRGNGFIKRR